MTRENVEVVKAIWPHEVDMVELAQRPHLPSQVADAIDPDAEIVFMSDAPGVPNRTYRGIAGFAEGWRDWLEPYESYRLEVEDFIDAGSDRVLAPARVQARTRRDGVLVEHFSGSSLHDQGRPARTSCLPSRQASSNLMDDVEAIDGQPHRA